MTRIRARRVYDAPEAGEGKRFLVDRLWPRGVSKERAGLEGWARDAAPSDTLRKRFHGHPERWSDFVARYREELDGAPDAWRPLLEEARRGPVTLLYASRDPEHNNAVVLKDYLEEKLAEG